MQKEVFDKSPQGGSVKAKIINPDLEAERKKLAFDQAEMERFIMGDEFVSDIQELNAFLKSSKG